MKGFNIYWGSGIALVFFIGIGLVSAKFLNLQGPEFYYLMMLMSVLGISASAFFYFFQKKAQDKAQARAGGGAGGGAAAGAGGGAAAGGGGGHEVDQLIRDADQRLTASKASGGAAIGNLPLIFIIGDQGTTKTSVMVNSGLEPELLAGQVYQDNNVAPTPSANVWFARNSIFVEAGGRLLAKPDAWTRLVSKIQPGKLKSVVSKGEQAPRAVLLCFDCEAFTRGSDQVQATARYLQARLGEISQLLGISFPVYVLFTRADRMAFFGDYVRNLTGEEATQVFGVTLPLAQRRDGVYAEEESRRLMHAFNELFYSLCDRRVDFLPREHDAEKIPGAYEFPREFRKIRASLVQMLVDMCRPSQLRASPFLRGFYFSGVRPITVNEVVAAPVRPAAAQQKQFEAGATRMFRAGMEMPQGAPGAGPQQGGARRVPQWLFVSHLFSDVIMADRAAMASSGASVKVSGRRRMVLSLASLLFLLGSGVFLWSYLNNHGLEKDAISAAKGLSGEKVTGTNLPTLAGLQKLDQLRASLQQLTAWHKDGHPLMYSAFLYAGDNMLPSVRTAYYNSFRDLLFGQVQGGWTTFLGNVKIPAAETDDYGYAYDTLKGYLLTTAEYKRSGDKTYQDFLSNLLFARWQSGREGNIDKQMSDIAKANFDFYARDLQNGNPYSEQPQADTVQHARVYLWGFNADKRLYQALLADAARKSSSIVFNRDYPGSDRIIHNNYPVNAAFTKAAFDPMMTAIQNADKQFGGERWVLGENPNRTQDVHPDWASTKKALSDQYVADYINAWRHFVKNSHFNDYTNLDDANTKLGVISANDSPLLRLFQVVSVNTSVDPRIKTIFDGAQRVVPPDSPGLTSDKTGGYMTGLNGLQISIQGALGKPLDATTSQPIITAANTATQARFQITTPFIADSGPFPADAPEHVDKEMTDLLQDPIEQAKNVGTIHPGQGLNAAGGAFCRTSAFTKFPFNPNPAAPDASIQEVNDIFRPKEGSLWKFYEATIKQYLTCTATGCTPTGALPLTPGFVAFMSESVRFSHALYGEAGTDPTLKYSVQPRSDQVETFTLDVDGAKTAARPGQATEFTWNGSSREFTIRVKVAGGGSDLNFTPVMGLWAPLKYFYGADDTIPGSTSTTFVFKPRQGKPEQPVADASGKPLHYEIVVDTHGGPAIFSKLYWQHLHCVPTVTSAK